ncbi:MAG: TlpA family protein disulfide reductase [Deltaproteobacteria bacterium]|jgi:peroxiredoxin|nr:TlpA family protein disulfide reductase [Deltaproteobacteria bacterium]
MKKKIILFFCLIFLLALLALFIAVFYHKYKPREVEQTLPDFTPTVEVAELDTGFLTGDAAPVFELPNVNNRVFNLANYKGRLVILTFWGSFCTPCMTGLDLLNNLYNKYKNHGLVVLAVNIDSKSNFSFVYDFVKDHKIRFPLLLDQEEQVTKLYKVAELPETFIIDPEGKFISIIDPVWAEKNTRINGDYPWDSEMYSNIIKELLEKYFGKQIETNDDSE